MKNVSKRLLSVLLALLMLATIGAVPFAEAAAAVDKVKTLKVTAVTQSKISLKWSKVDKASGYCVYSYDAKKDAWTVETYTTATTFTDKSLASGTKYTYKVAAYQKNGTSRVFGKDSAKVSAITKPARVTKLTAKVVNPTKIKLTWDAAEGATGYVIYGKIGDGKYKKVASTKKRAYVVKYNAAPGVVYYKVRAFAKSGKSTQYADKFSPTAKIKAMPARVSSLTATNIGGASATLKWTAAAGASEYVIYKKDIGTNGEYVKVATTNKTTYDIKYPASPRTVHFSVQSSATVDGNTVVAAKSSPVYVSMWPKPVTALYLKKSGHDYLTLEWQKADGASMYRVYQYIGGVLEEIGTTGETTYTVKGLAPESSYSFRVRAVADYLGQITETEFSPVLTAMTSFGTVKGATVVVNSDNSAMLSWDALKGADGYQIEKKVGGDWALLGESMTTVFSVSGKEDGEKLAAGKTYLYRVRAYVEEEGERVYSPYTDVIEVHSVPGKPGTAKAATGSDHAIVIDWPAVEGADGYHVQYYNKNGKWIDDVDILGADVHTYQSKDGKLRAYYAKKQIEVSGTYQFRVAAAVSNDGRLTYGAYGDPVSHNYTYEPEPEVTYTDATKETGVMGYLYDENENVFYTADDPWQRNFGFNKLYDVASQFVWIQYDTIRFYFTYQGSEWMLQPWKGQYGAVLYGAELGVYKKYTERDADHFDCAQDQDRLQMSMDFERCYFDDAHPEGEWRHEFYRPYGTYWWCTGFKLGYIRLSTPFSIISINEDAKDQTFPEIRANYRVTMKDYEMLEVFIDAIKAAGYTQINYTNGVKPGKLKFAYHDLDVYFPF